MSWWRHQIEAFSALLAHCAGNSPVTIEKLVAPCDFDTSRISHDATFALFFAILKIGIWLLLNVIIQSRKKSIVIWRFCLSLRFMIIHQVVDYWHFVTWWHHQMGIFSALLALCAGNSPPTQWCIIWSELNKRLSKQSWGWWCETPSR